jgi:hypothetical protein
MKALAKVKIGVIRKEIHKMATKTKVRRKGSTRKIYNVIIFRSGVTLQLNANLRKYQEKNLMRLSLFMKMMKTNGIWILDCIYTSYLHCKLV